ncbi:MAG: hypothetical protein SGJ05_07045 [bacterium]|nr:hypothetical protein [bacterium]
MRYDETRLEIADIKSAVRQRGYAADAPTAVPADKGHEDHAAQGVPPATPAAAAPTTAVVTSAADADSEGDEQRDKTAPDES